MRRLMGVIAVVVAALAFGIVASRPASPPAGIPADGDLVAAARTIEALLRPESGVDPLATLPADFSRVEKTTPVHLAAPDGTTRAVHVDGGCSTPWGDENTRWDYSVGCKAHDLGYDLLRYAEKKGHPLPADLRRRLDDKLSEDMHRQCELNPRNSADLCEVIAGLYTAGLVVNSWHQRWGPPRAEPISSWAAGLLIVIFLLAVRPPWLRRENAVVRDPVSPGPVDEYMSLLRVFSLAGIVIGETVLAFTHISVSWLLQLAPLLFFAGGHANLQAWRGSGGDYGTYLATRIHALLKPVFAFVLAWLVVPLSLELLDAPDGMIDAVGRVVLQPLWLLGIFLITVAAGPAMQWLGRRLGVAVPVVFLLASTAVDLAGVSVHVSGLLLALGFGQLASHWETLRLLSRPVLLSVAAVALTGFVLLGYLPLLGVVQVCLACSVRTFDWVPVRVVGVVRSIPMTAYLVYVGLVLLFVGVASAAGLDWFTRPRTWLGIAMIGISALVAFLWFERRPGTPDPLPGSVSGVHPLASALGVGYGTLGVLGFSVTGVTWQVGVPTLFGLALDPMANLIHLMLGWYLLHTVRAGRARRPGPWLLTAAACIPPIFTTWSLLGAVLHGMTTTVALTVVVRVLSPAAARRTTMR